MDLYQDCLLHRPQPFFQTLFPAQKWYSDRFDTDIKIEGSPNPTKQDQLSRIKTLRFSQSPFIAEADYYTLLTDSPFCWATAGTLRYPHDPLPPINQTDRFVHDAKAYCDFSIWIRRMIRMGYPVLPSLKRVVMLGEKDDATSMTLNQVPKGLPDSLVNLPSVQYYCHKSLFGPFTLRNNLAKIYHPPKVATFHVADPDICSNWANALPVILGATNRYIFLSCPVKIASKHPSTPSDVDDQWLQALSTSVLAMLRRTRVQKQLLHVDQPCESVTIDTVSLEGTKIEMYNLIGNLILPAPKARGYTRTKAEKEIKPPDIKVRQALARLVDTQIGPWKGKVSFHNIDDIPLCPACQVPDTTKPALSSVMSL
jgi:hypothetical protein